MKVTLKIECKSLLDAAVVESWVKKNTDDAKCELMVNGESIATDDSKPDKPKKTSTKRAANLTPSKVAEVYRLRNLLTASESAKKFGISYQSARRIYTGKHVHQLRGQGQLNGLA